MSAPATAQIIPFPINAEARSSQSVQVASAAEPRAKDDQQERLSRALASLDAALAEQRVAMSGWRESLDHLRKATTGLGLSMQRYHRTLGKLGTDVSDLHAKSVQLERWADKALSKQD
jgi:predicted ATPase with chaperone activity